MRVATESPQERINLRLQGNAKKALERAAGFEGKTVSNFILTTALTQADKIIRSHEVMQLNRQDADRFFNALVKPLVFKKKLSAAFEEHHRRVTSQ